MLRCLVLGITLAVPTITLAQTRDTTAVPRELVLALLSARSYGDAENLTIGTVPRGFPRELVAETSTLLGGVSIRAERPMSSSLMIVARSNVSSDSTLALVERQLERNGWRQPSLPEMGRGRGGFVAVAFGPDIGKFFCRDDRMVSTRASQLAGGGAYLTVSLSSARHSACDERAQRRQMAFDDQIDFPTLRAPSGVRSFSSGSSGSDNYRESSTRLTTTQTPTLLIDHFGEQLKQAGWTISGRLANENVAVLTTNRLDKNGRRMYGTLIATRLGDNEREATFRVVVPDQDR